MFAYVRTDSQHYEQLVTALGPIIGREPSEMDFFAAPR
jgi:hypothetical protein